MVEFKYITNAYVQLADIDTGYYIKSWQEIYELVKKN
jgi:hypothetical protein